MYSLIVTLFLHERVVFFSEPSTSSSLSLLETLTAIPSTTCPSCPSSAVGYSAGLGVISVILITSLLGNVTLLVIVVLNIRKGKCSNE